MTGEPPPPLAFPLPRERPLDPPGEYARLRREAPVAPVRLWDGSTAWLVSRYRDVRRLLGDPRCSADPSRPGYPMVSPTRPTSTAQDRALNHLDPPAHTRFRAMLAPHFSPSRVEALRPAVEEVVGAALDDLARAGPPADLVPGFALRVPSAVVCRLLGVPYEDHDFFERRTVARFRLDAEPGEVAAATAELDGYLHEVVAERRRRPGDDLVSSLLRDEVDRGTMTVAELVGIVRLLLVNGYETTANMLALGVVVLDAHPDQRARFVAGPSTTVDRTVDELLRYATIIHLSPVRAVTGEVEVASTRLVRGDGVILALAAANRDPAVFEAPDEFDVTRARADHVAFGYGRHHCLGHRLARLELAVGLRMLLRRLPTLRVAAPIDALPFKTDMAVYGVHRLPVTW